MRAEMQFVVVYADGTPREPRNGSTEEGTMPLYRARHLLMQRLKESAQFFADLDERTRMEFYVRFQTATIGELLDGVLVTFGERFFGILPVGMKTAEAGQVRPSHRPKSPAEQIAARAAAAGRQAVAG